MGDRESFEQRERNRVDEGPGEANKFKSQKKKLQQGWGLTWEGCEPEKREAEVRPYSSILPGTSSMCGLSAVPAQGGGLRGK